MDRHVATAGSIDAADKAQERAFARTIVTNQGDALSVTNREGYVTQGVYHSTTALASQNTAGNGAKQGRSQAAHLGGKYRDLETDVSHLQKELVELCALRGCVAAHPANTENAKVETGHWMSLSS